MANGYSRNLYCDLFEGDKFLDLSPEQRLLFIYLFGNKDVLRCGIVRISYRKMELQSGLSRPEIVKSLELFASADYQWIEQDEAYIWLVDFIEDQCNSAKWFIGARREAESLLGKTLLAERCLDRYPVDWFGDRTAIGRRSDGDASQVLDLDTALDTEQKRKNPRAKRALTEREVGLLVLVDELAAVIDKAREDSTLAPFTQNREASAVVLRQMIDIHGMNERGITALTKWMFKPDNAKLDFNLQNLSSIAQWRKQWKSGVAIITKVEEMRLWLNKHQRTA